ncbi:MAG: cysteine desulfurase [Bacteroidota bacterium]
MLDITKIRSDFPILQTKIHGKPLIYFDNAATTQKPKVVIESLVEYYSTYNSNIHRGVHTLSQKATEAYEQARKAVATFINAPEEAEVIFTRGTTEAINLVAFSYCERFLKTGDEIIISTLEHHSNIVPWQMACEKHGANLKIIPINDEGEIEFEVFKSMLNEKVKLVAIGHVSNALGTINPIEEIIKHSHSLNIPVMIDGAQATAHIGVDIQKLDCDFYCLSGHKMYGPTGIGVLYGKRKWLDAMPPYQGGGDMIDKVSFEKTTYSGIPLKFEAGTQNIADAIALHKAIDYLTEIGLDKIEAYEHELLQYATAKFMEIEGMKIYGTAKNKSAIVSFIANNIHPYDMGTILDKLGIAVRTGHHCTQPLMDRFKIPGTVRASFAFYNTKEEIDDLVDGIKKVIAMFS